LENTSKGSLDFERVGIASLQTSKFFGKTKKKIDSMGVQARYFVHATLFSNSKHPKNSF
jgi:hypothetical protein